MEKNMVAELLRLGMPMLTPFSWASASMEESRDQPRRTAVQAGDELTFWPSSTGLSHE